MTRRKRLIEVAFPLEEVSAHSRREKNVRHGHISTLHIWWARRPLAACRAFIYASLVDDPETDAEREELLKEVADLASWDAVRSPGKVVRTHEQGGSELTGAQLLERARRRILDCNGGRPPRLLDPFAGGGAIPLEALRLGCEVEASDLNPVAVLILKGTVEYPQKYGRPLAEQRAQRDRGERTSIAGVNGEVPSYIRQAGKQAQSSFGENDSARAYEQNPLAADVRYWGNWMLDRAHAELAELYPPDPDGSRPVAYLWSRTVPCPNCGAEMPLIRQYWLARKPHKTIALKPDVDFASKRVDFQVVEGPNVTGNPAEATTTRGDTLCLVCRQVVKAEYTRQAGRDGKMSATMIAVVLEAQSNKGKRYRADMPSDGAASDAAAQRLTELEASGVYEIPPIPDEPINPDTLGLRIDAFGFDAWGKLFNARQLLTLSTFARITNESYLMMNEKGVDPEYARSVTTYLALAIDRLADYGSTLCVWRPQADQEKVNHTFARQALSMVWDFAESNPFAASSGGWMFGLGWIVNTIEALSQSSFSGAVTQQRNAAIPVTRREAVLTDPPYYDAIDYAGLSDFFYVWLKRSIAPLYPELLSLPLTPKREQAIMASETGDPTARERYVRLMGEAFRAMSQSVQPDGCVGVVFAHNDPDAWATLIDGLIIADLVPDASWPIDTELENKTSAASRANLKTSVWMVCKPRGAEAPATFIDDVMCEMRPVIQERLLYFWSKGIRGADFFISAIGPALSVFGRYRRVLRPDGSEVTVRDFLDLVRRESTRVALEQVLQGADLGVVDPITRQYVTWVWSYSRTPLDAGEAIALCLAAGADYREVVRVDSIAVEAKEASKKVVKLRSIKDRGREQEQLGVSTPARPAPLVDQLHRAAWLWGMNRPEELTGYRSTVGETRWAALRTLGQAVAESLPEGDEDRRLINGLLGSNIMAATAPEPRAARRSERQATAGARLPGLDEETAG